MDHIREIITLFLLAGATGAAIVLWIGEAADAIARRRRRKKECLKRKN